MKPDDNEERRGNATLLRVPAFTFATISDAALLEHPSSEQKMRGGLLRSGHSIRLDTDLFDCPLEVQVATRKIERRSLIRAAF